MKVKANVSFCGVVSMTMGEEREIEDEDVLKDLLASGYVSELKADAEGKTGKTKAKK